MAQPLDWPGLVIAPLPPFAGWEAQEGAATGPCCVCCGMVAALGIWLVRRGKARMYTHTHTYVDTRTEVVHGGRKGCQTLIGGPWWKYASGTLGKVWGTAT